MEEVGGADSTCVVAERRVFFTEAEGETPASGSNDLLYFFNKLRQTTIIN